MPRYALKIEYHGAPFYGWQKQAEFPSVQSAIETALSKLESDVPTIGAAGRTDKGVHALGQVAHCDMRQTWNPFRLMEAVNFHLKPAPIAIVDAAAVDDAWHARFSATQRRYRFRLLSRRAPATVDAGLVWQIRHPLALAPMQDAAKLLLGTHDFTTFRSTICQSKSPVKTLDRLDITEHVLAHGVEFRFEVVARSFLHNQVRSFVGTLQRVGAGAWQPERVREALEAKDRAACGHVSPPEGLYLSRVGYPDDPFA